MQFIFGKGPAIEGEIINECFTCTFPAHASRHVAHFEGGVKRVGEKTVFICLPRGQLTIHIQTDFPLAPSRQDVNPFPSFLV